MDFVQRFPISTTDTRSLLLGAVLTLLWDLFCSWVCRGEGGGGRLSLSNFVCLDALRPSQQFFRYVRTGLPGLNQY